MYSDDDELSATDIGTDEDTGSLDPRATGDYAGEPVEDYDSFEGLAYAIAKGSLQRQVLSQPDSSNILTKLIYQMLERKAVTTGDVVAAVEQLSFEPDGEDLFNGARLQCRNGYIIAHDGMQQKIFRYDSTEKLITRFVMAGAFAMTGMIRTLAAL